MFGRLETPGEFASQKGLTRKPIPDPPLPPAILKPGVQLFTDRDYTLIEAPEFLLGQTFSPHQHRGLYRGMHLCPVTSTF